MTDQREGEVELSTAESAREIFSQTKTFALRLGLTSFDLALELRSLPSVGHSVSVATLFLASLDVRFSH